LGFVANAERISRVGKKAGALDGLMKDVLWKKPGVYGSKKELSFKKKERKCRQILEQEGKWTLSVHEGGLHRKGREKSLKEEKRRSKPAIKKPAEGGIYVRCTMFLQTGHLKRKKGSKEGG